MAASDGECLPPFVVHKAKHRYKEWEENESESCPQCLRQFESTFLEPFCQILLQFFKDQEGPKLLISCPATQWQILRNAGGTI